MKTRFSTPVNNKTDNPLARETSYGVSVYKPQEYLGVDAEPIAKAFEAVDALKRDRQKNALARQPEFEKLREALKMEAHSGVNNARGKEFEDIYSNYLSKYSKDYNYAFTSEGIATKQKLVNLVNDPRYANAAERFKQNKEDYKRAEENGTLDELYFEKGAMRFKDDEGNERQITPEQLDNMSEEARAHWLPQVKRGAYTAKRYYEDYDQADTYNNTNKLNLSAQHSYKQFSDSVKEKFQDLGRSVREGIVGKGMQQFGVSLADIGQPGSPLMQIVKYQSGVENNASQIKSIKDGLMDMNLLSQEDVDAFRADYFRRTGDFSARKADDALLGYISAIANGKRLDIQRTDWSTSNTTEADAQAKAASGQLPPWLAATQGMYGNISEEIQTENGTVVVKGAAPMGAQDPVLLTRKNAEGAEVPLRVSELDYVKGATGVFNAFGQPITDKAVLDQLVPSAKGTVITKMPMLPNGQPDFQRLEDVAAMDKRIQSYQNHPNPKLKERAKELIALKDEMMENWMPFKAIDVIVNEDNVSGLGTIDGKEPVAKRGTLGLGREVDPNKNQRFREMSGDNPQDEADRQRYETTLSSSGIGLPGGRSKNMYRTRLYIYSTDASDSYSSQNQVVQSHNAGVVQGPKTDIRNNLAPVNTSPVIPYKGK